MATGSYVGDGVDGRGVTGLGFAPAVVLIKADEGFAAVLTTATMGGKAKELATDISASSSHIRSLDADGFTIGDSGEVNTASVTYRWVAFAQDDGRVKVGAYFGYGNDNRLISVGFQPDYVIVVPVGSTFAHHRNALLPDDDCLTFHKSRAVHNRIQSFTDQGFVVGDDADVNMLFGMYHYVAWAAASDRTASGTYVGDGNDSRDLNVGFRPSWVLTKGAHDEEAVHLPSSLPGPNESQHFVTKTNEDKDILALLDQGFQIGKDWDVNENGKTYYWTAFGNQADGQVTLTADRDTALAGQTVVLTATLTDLGPDPARMVEISLPLGGDFDFVSAAADLGTYDEVTGVWAVPVLPNGDLATLSLTAAVAAGTAGQDLSLSADLTALDGNDPQPINDSAAVVITVPYSADLTAGAVTDTAAPAPGATVVLTYTVDNAGPDAATGVQAHVVLPAGLTYVSHTQTLGSFDPVTRDWTMATLGAGESVQLAVTVRVRTDWAGRVLTSGLAAVSAVLDPVPGDNTATVDMTVSAADVGISMSVDDLTPRPGGQVTFQVALVNHGPDVATGVVVADSIPAGFTYQASTVSQGSYVPGTGRWTVGDLASGASALLELTLRLTAGATGEIVNTAVIIASAPGDPVPDNDGVAASVTVLGVDIAASAGVDVPAPNAGEQAVLTFGLSNQGGLDASGIAADVTLPAGLTYVGHTAGQGTFEPLGGVWTVGDLAATAACSLQVTVAVDAGTAGSTLVSLMAVSGVDQTDIAPANDAASVPVTVREVQLALSKSVDDPTPNQGSQVTFTLLLTNAGPDVATAVAVADTLPAGLTFVSATADQGSYTEGTGLWDVGDLGPGDAVQLELTALANLDVAGGATAVNHAWIVAHDEEDLDATDDHDTASLSLASADLNLTAAVDEPLPVAGDPVRFSLTLRNDGPVAATGVTVRDSLAVGLTYVSHTTATPAYDPVTGIWTVGDLAAGNTVVLTIDATVDADRSGQILVTRPRITALDQSDPDDADNAAQVPVTVQAADLALAWAPVANPTEGDTLTARLVLHDDGPDLLQTAAVAVTVPPGFHLLATSPRDGSYGSGVWSLTDISAGADAVLELEIQVEAGTAGSDLVLSAAVAAARPGDPEPSVAASELSLHVRGTDLAVEKQVNVTSARTGETVIYTLAVRNDGPDAAGAVRVNDLLPEGMIYLSHTPAASAYDPVTGAWDVGALAVGQTANLFLQARVGDVALGGSVINTVAVVAADLVETGPGNETASASFGVPAADVGLSLAGSVPEGSVGEQLDVTVTARNDGPDTATGLVVGVTLPESLELTGFGAGFDPVLGRWVVGDLDVTATRDLILTVRVAAAAAGDTVRVDAAVSELEQGDEHPADNAASLLLPVADDADLSVSVTADRSRAAVGDTMTWTVVLTNLGPSDAPGPAVRDTLPAGMTVTDWSTDHGTYDPVTHLWSVGAVAADVTATLELQAEVPVGAGGSDLQAAAVTIAGDVGDRNPANNHAVAAVHVAGADLALQTWVDLTLPGEGDDVILTFAVNNLGPDAASGVAVLDTLPAGLTYVSHTPPDETFADLGGGIRRWEVGDVQTQAPRVLFLRTRVAEGTTGVELRNAAVVQPGLEEDPDPDNNAVTNILTVGGADLVMAVALDAATAAEGDTVTALVTLTNLGPLDASGVTVLEHRDPKLVLLDVTPSEGYEPGTGRWTVGALPVGGTAVLELRLLVAELSGGLELDQAAGVIQVDQVDPTPSDAAASAAVTVLVPESGRILLTEMPVDDARVHPLGGSVDLLRMQAVNWSVRSDTLQSLAVTDLAELDGEPAGPAVWSSLALWRQVDGEWTLHRKLLDPFGGDRIMLHGLGLVFAPGDTVFLAIRGGAAAAAADSTSLRIGIDGPGSFGFTAPVSVEAEWPLATTAAVVVDGFVAAQAVVHEVPAGVMAPGERQRPALDVTLPGNGAEADVLREIQVVNIGTALPAVDLTRLEIWADDGNGSYDVGSDALLGEAVWTGDRWRLSGLDRLVPAAGLRVFVTADAASTADGQHSLRLAIPVNGIEMDGGNDGPLDGPLANPFTMVVGGTDRLYMAAVGRPWRVVQPDGGEELLLHLTATNTFDVSRSLQSLRLTGDVRSPWTEDQATLDAVVAQLVLRADADDDGVPGTDDEFLGAVSLSEGAAVFGGLEWSVPPATTRHLFVSARLAPDLAADGDDVAVTVASAVDVQLDGGGEITGSWPLDGGGGLRVDGMLARRITVRPGRTFMASPGATDRLVMDVHVPGNGHAADVLHSITLENRGTATSADVARLWLWRDGGDDVFDAGAGAGDDSVLVDLTAQFGVWSATGLDLPVAASGARLYVAADLTAAARDSATVDLAIPLGGLGYASDDDGPLDATVSAGTVLLVGDGALLAGLGLSTGDVVVGQDAELTLTVSNEGLVAVTGVAPTALTVAGGGSVAVVAGPLPTAADLAPGAGATFTWTVRGSVPGDVILTVAAAGEDPDGPVATLPISSPALHVVQPAPEIVLTAVSQLPFAVNGGQTDVSALTLTLQHPGDPEASAVRLDTLMVRLEDGAGLPVDAGGVLNRVLLRVDGALLMALTPTAGAGDVLDLIPSTPPLLAPGESGVLTLGLEVADVAAGAEFRFVLDEGGLAARDAVADVPVGVILATGEFPVRSELTRVVDGAASLLLDLAAGAQPQATRGQQGVSMGVLQLTNPGDPELGAGIQVGVARVALRDAAGQTVPDPSLFISAVELIRDGDLLARRSVPAGAESLMDIALDTPLDVDPGPPLNLEVRVDLQTLAPPGLVGLLIPETQGWDVRDANSGVPVDVVAAATPLAATPVDVLEPATLAHLGGSAVGSMILTAGAADQPLLELDVRHPGASGTASVTVDSLAFRCLDAAGNALNPAAVLAQLIVSVDGEPVGGVAVPDAANGLIRLELTGVTCEPGSQVSLAVAGDVRATALTDTFALTVGLADVRVVDTHLGTRLQLTADAGAVLPLSTGHRVIRVAADELVVAVRDLMPAAIAALGAETPALALDLTNTATAAAGDLVLTRLDLAAASVGAGKFASAAGTMVAEIVLRHGGDVWARSGALTPGDSLISVAGVTPLTLGPGDTETVEVQLLLAPALTEGSLTIAMDLDGLGVRQPEGELVTVRVLPAAGQVFPFVTQPGTISPASLEASYSNFPNPFAAGREGTTFVFGLAGPARVALKVYTPRGELVRTLLAGEDRAAGLHQDVMWDGRNGLGDAVRNGVYVAEIVVRASGGETVTLRRNVAVVR